MKKVVSVFVFLFLAYAGFAQYTITGGKSTCLGSKKLAILLDEDDTAANTQLKQLFSKYWNISSSVMLATNRDLPELLKTGEYVFIRHQARIEGDPDKHTRSDYLSIFSNGYADHDIALCYIDSKGMNHNLLCLKFCINAIQSSLSCHENGDTANLIRNSKDLSELRHNTLIIPESILEKESPAGASYKTGTEGMASTYTFKCDVLSEKQMNDLSWSDSRPVYLGNVMNLPDGTSYLYVCEVNSGKIVYKSRLQGRLLRDAELHNLNMAVLNTSLQSSVERLSDPSNQR